MRTAAAPHFPIRGIIEGFYGTYYTFPQRNDLIRFAAEHDFNFYLYGPKNDRQHRMRWWEPYPDRILDEFAHTIELASAHGVRFCYAISFGVPMNYALGADFDIVAAKFRAFYDRGCRAFGILVDDTADEFAHDENRRNFPSVAHAHADVANHVRAWLDTLNEPCSLLVAPTEYWGIPPFSNYLHTLGRELRPDIDLCYTGRAICTPTITLADVEAFANAAGRTPLIWDNYPVNDLAMQWEMHVGPLRGRDVRLWQASSGFLANAMNQPEASKIALSTIADYLRDPEQYDPDESWQRALREAAGEESYLALRAFAENSLGSVLSNQEAPRLDSLVVAAMDALERGESARESEALLSLTEYLTELDEAGYHLKNRMANLTLRQEIVPWIEALEEDLWMGRSALTCLRSMEDGADYSSALRFMDELVLSIRRRQRRVGGTRILELAHLVHRRVEEAQGGAPRPQERGHLTSSTSDEGLREPA